MLQVKFWCEENAMLKSLCHGCSEFSKLDIIDFIDKYFIMETIAFLSITITWFHEAQMSWSTNVSMSILRNPLTIITFYHHDEWCGSQSKHVEVNTKRATFLQLKS